MGGNGLAAAGAGQRIDPVEQGGVVGDADLERILVPEQQFDIVRGRPFGSGEWRKDRRNEDDGDDREVSA
jgi:hypothetical protein